MEFHLGDYVVVKKLSGEVIREGIITAKFLGFLLVDEVGGKTPMSLIGGFSYPLAGMGVLFTIEKAERPV